MSMVARGFAFKLIALLLAVGMSHEARGTAGTETGEPSSPCVPEAVPVSNDAGEEVEPDAAEPAVVATVTYSSGRNRLRRAATGRLQRLVTETDLHEGDRITVSYGGRVTVVFAANGEYRTLESGEEVVVEAPEEEDGSEPHEEQELDRRRVNDAVLDSLRREREGSMAAVGGTRLPDDPRKPAPIFPRQTKLMPRDSITFRWEESRLGADAWRVAVLAEGEELLSTVTEATEWTVGPDELRFEPGRLYAWYVMPDEEGTSIPEPKPFFLLLDDEQAARVQEKLDANAALAAGENDPAPRFLDARVLLAEGLLAEAQAILEELYATSPGDTGLLERLRETYTAQRYSPREVDARIDALRRAHPEFREPRHIEVAEVSTDEEGERHTMRITFTGTDHLDAEKYRLTWRKLTEDGEPQPATGGQLTLRHNPDNVGATYEAELPAVHADKTYRLKLEVLDEEGNLLRFDIPVEPQTVAAR